MTDPELIGFVRDALADIREGLKELRADVKALGESGCKVGARNTQRLDELDKRSAVAGGGAGLFAALVVAVVNYLLGRPAGQ